jgi:hypothetical protein
MPRVLGKALAIGGAALAGLATFMPAYDNFDEDSVTYWTFHTRWDIVTIIIVAAVVTLGILSIVRPMRGVNIALAATAAATAGIFLPYPVEASEGVKAGIFLMGAGGVIACIGAIFVLLTEFAAVPAPQSATPPPAPTPARAPAAVPAGWFPDPAGSPGHRYWDGQAWTQHVQPAGARA